MGSSRAGQKSRVWRFLLLGVCMMLLAVAIVTNIMWAVSFASVFLVTRISSTPSPPIITTPPTIEFEVEDVPDMKWEEVAEAPVARLDGAAVQIGGLLYVFAGYASIDEVHAHVDIYNLSSNSWGSSFAMPTVMAHSHLGMATDGRFIYAVSGQFGPQCRGSTAQNFVLDTQTRNWSQLLPLPAPRYAPATQLWRGRLHVMGGSKEDRNEPAIDHWSLAVQDGKGLELEWRMELPIPRGGPHRACVVVEDRLYVIGGQEGDFMAKRGSPIFKCSRQKEVVYGDVYMLEANGKVWKELPGMPKPNSHIEFAWIKVNHSVITVGGSTQKNPVTKKMVLLAEIFHFNTHTQVWKSLGRMPYRAKTALAAYWGGWLYFTAGQRDKGLLDPSPKKIMAKTWRTNLELPPN